MTAPKRSDEKILTLHPEGKQGVRIAKWRYDAMRKALLRVIPRRRSGVAFQELPMSVEDHLDLDAWGEASVTWYLVTVKQDLEARGTIEQVPGVKPQHLRRSST